MTKNTNEVWKNKLQEVTFEYDYNPSPRGQQVREKQPGTYTVDMPAYLSLETRKVNVPFMFAEAWWILSGSNTVEDIEPYMKMYRNFSDDGEFLRGAYGPKITDQLGYVVDSLEADEDTRQAVLNIWRERPGSSKDIPCTTNMQFFIRDEEINMVSTMRSNDIVLGFTYDVFTFSMVAKAVQLLLRARGIRKNLGSLTVNAGSLHIYERHFDQVEDWLLDESEDVGIGNAVAVLEDVDTFGDLKRALKELADCYDENTSN